MTTLNRPSPLVRYCGFAAIAFLILVPVAILVVRSGHWREGLLLYTLAGALSLLLLALFAVLTFLPRFVSERGIIARKALFCLIPAGLLISALLSGGRYPPIHDITNNLDNPPAFITAAKQRGESSNPVTINPAAITVQRDSYPALNPVTTSLAAAKLYDITRQTMRSQGWHIYNDDAEKLVLEAVATTTVMAFKDDIIARVRPLTNGGSALDLRSVSRVGVSDMGANYKRLLTFSKQLQDNINTQP